MNIGLLMAGSPCQGFSRNGNGLNFDDPRSKLFFDFVKIKDEKKPKYWLLENVKMKNEWRDIISEILGVEPIFINSGLVSAQKRTRYYWTNIPNVEQPIDRNICLADIVANDVTDDDYKFSYDEIERVLTIKDTIYVRTNTKEGVHIGYNGDGIDMAVPKSDTRRARIATGKTNTLDTSCRWAIFINGKIRWLTITELERLQTLPDRYTEGVSLHQRKKMIGNGWNVDTIAHILSYIPDQEFDNVVSLFDGMSCGQVALARANKTYQNYYASEIDKNAIAITMRNYPNTIQLGDIKSIEL